MLVVGGVGASIPRSAPGLPASQKCQPNSGQPHSAGEAEILMSALQAGFFALFSLLVFPETEVRLTLFVYGYAAEQQCSSPGSALPASITMLPYFAQ